MHEEGDEVLTQETIGFNPAKDQLFVRAFSSRPFARRLNATLDLLVDQGVESGFLVHAENRSLVYPPLIVGHEHGVGLNITTAEPVIGVFHLHPSGLSFSDGDVVDYDENSSDRRFRPDRVEGIIMPVRENNSLMGTITSLRLLMYSGPPTDTYYQAADLYGRTVDEQRAILERSGLRTLVVDVPILPRSVDVRPMRAALQQHFV